MIGTTAGLSTTAVTFWRTGTPLLNQLLIVLSPAARTTAVRVIILSYNSIIFLAAR